MVEQLPPKCTSQPSYLAFVGRISPEKGPKEAIKIARATSFPLKMAGKIDAVDRNYYQEVIEPLIDGEQIQYLGEVSLEEKVELLAKAAVTLFPITWREPFGLVMIERAEQDVYLLRQSFGQGKVLAAGVPWFSALFGRDSIIAGSQTLVLNPAIAKETLSVLACYQGQEENTWREEEPGKILHELRLGELARCGEIPHTPYYGTVDATPLWLMLYAEYYFWTNDQETLESLWSNALAAMEWIDRNLKETGYLSYQRRSPGG